MDEARAQRDDAYERWRDGRRWNDPSVPIPTPKDIWDAAWDWARNPREPTLWNGHRAYRVHSYCGVCRGCRRYDVAHAVYDARWLKENPEATYEDLQRHLDWISDGFSGHGCSNWDKTGIADDPKESWEGDTDE